MAKHLGATVYTTASAANTDYVRSLGADVIIDYQKDSYERAILEAEPDGVDMVLEALLGDGTDEAAIRIAKSGGAVAYMNNEPPDMPDISARGIRAEFIHHRADGAMLSELGALYEQGLLPLPQTETLPLSAAVEAHRRSESRRTRGKLVLSIATL
jgi:NADPH2:quinone reductase